jgi:DNA polymerase-3 subunit delta
MVPWWQPMMLFVYGDDHLRVKERTEDFKAKFVAKYDPTGMNVDDITVRSGALPNVGEVLQAVQAAPFLSEKRLVIIRGLVDALKKTDAKPWIEGFLRTPESTVVVFSDDISATDFAKKELAKALAEVPDVHKYALAKLEGNELIIWAKERIVKLGMTITPTLLQEVFQRTKDDAWRIDAELEKLAAYANGEPVSMQMIDLLVRADAEADIFGFMDALSSPSAKKALDKLSSEREAGADSFQLYGMLLRQLRLLVQARGVIDLKPGATKQDLATAMGIHPFVAQKVLAEVKAWSEKDLVDTHALAMKLDKAMKSGIQPEISVDRLVSEWLV